MTLLRKFVIFAMLLVLPMVAAAQEYRIRTGDTLAVEVLNDPSLNRDLLVSPDGAITFPQVGRVRAAGRTLEQVQSNIASGLAPTFAESPRVFVALRSQRAPTPPSEPRPPRTITAYVLGEVNSPGAIDLPPKSTLLQLLSRGGGPSRFAAQKRIQLRRLNPATQTEQIYVINLKDFLSGRGMPRTFIIQDGDVVYVPERRLFE